MKKLLAFVLAGILAAGTCMVAFAAPSAEAVIVKVPPIKSPSQGVTIKLPSDKQKVTIHQDVKPISVSVFDPALAAISTDGSIEISGIGPSGSVDVMVNGAVTKNVDSVDLPGDLRLRALALEKGSVIAKVVTVEVSDDVKKQIADAYAAGEGNVDLKPLSGVTAYKVNENGDIENADGETVSGDTLGIPATSVDAAAESFGEVMEEIMAEDRAREAAEQNRPGDGGSSDAVNVPAPITGSGSGATTNPESPSPSPSTDPGESPSPSPSMDPGESPSPSTAP